MYLHDVSVSFAGEDREIASKIANRLQSCNVSVFFDEFEQANLTGRDLTIYLSDVYSNKARYCALIISKSYLNK